MREPTNEVKVERDVPVTMPDGVVLLTDMYHPVGVDDAPTILERTPYGREAISGMAASDVRRARLPLRDPGVRAAPTVRAGRTATSPRSPDGRSTADWISEQPWFDGSLGTYGGSYMGFTQWALASTQPPHLKAMAVALATSVRRFSWYPGDSYALEIIIPWDLGAVNFNKPGSGRASDISPEAIAEQMRNLRQGFDHLPLGDAITVPHRRGPSAVPRPARARRARRPVLGRARLPARCSRAGTSRPCSSTAGTTTRAHACSTTTPSSRGSRCTGLAADRRGRPHRRRR